LVWISTRVVGPSGMLKGQEMGFDGEHGSDPDTHSLTVQGLDCGSPPLKRIGFSVPIE